MKKRKPHCVKLSLKEEIVEGRPEHGLFSRKKRTALHDLLRVLANAARSPRVAAVLLTMENLSAGWAQLSDLRRALLKFREAGKPVYSFIASGGNGEYYVASACDRVYMPPAASLHLVGLASEVFFFRDVLDRLGVEAQVSSIGEFKSAAEMLTRTGMSAPAREQMEALLDDFSREFRGALASGRGLTPEGVGELVDAGPYGAREAAGLKLLDGVCYPDELEEKLNEAVGRALAYVGPEHYLDRSGFVRRLLTWNRPRIGVIDVLGTIAGGEIRRDHAGRHIAGAETLGSFIEHARKSRRVKAVVLRVDSPGGTGVASDELWRELSLLAQAKPLVVSFGDVAASGGYYIAAPGSIILAEPTTVTGSIGVLGGKVVARHLMARLSVHREALRRGDHAEYDSPFAPFSPAEMERLQRQLDEFYREDFVKKVAAGRKMTEQDVDRAGRGRVWSGVRARELGLVDWIGGIEEAVGEARRLAGIPEAKRVRVAHYQRRRRLREMLVPDFSPQFSAWMPQPSIDACTTLQHLAENTVLLWMPFQIRIR